AWAALVALWVSLCGGVAAQGQATTEPGAISGSGAGKTSQSELLWQKLEATVQKENSGLDGTMGVAILDLTDGRVFLQNPDHQFATASSIKVAILAELYRQQQEADEGAGGKARLGDLYTFDAHDLVDGSTIMSGLTAGVTRVTNRDLATFMVAVSDNSATNVLIERVGMQNVNGLLDSLGLHHTRLQRKMMDVKAAQEGRENIATPREMMTLLASLYEKKVLNKALTDDFFKVLGTPKESDIPRYIPEGVVCANKPGQLAGVRNDVGVIFVPNRPFVIVVMTAYLKHEREGDDAIARIAGAAYDYFDRLARSSVYGRMVTEGTSH
ncbi:MAG TPA: serine hydrolase, partial [Candidatus Limnocylindrales bacterium]|nr:serine hydrolase [Candidatus Limnocylindrales bacterium]